MLLWEPILYKTLILMLIHIQYMWMVFLHLQKSLVMLNVMLSSFLLQNSLYFGVNEIISFHKIIGNLDKMTVANLGRQHHRSLDSYFKSS